MHLNRYDFGTVNLWLGFPQSSEKNSAAVSTNAHFDGADNLFVVLSGQKTFQIW